MKLSSLLLVIFALGLASSCEKEKDVVKPLHSTISEHTLARESVLRDIPKKYIDKARTTLHIAYQHTSHGQQVFQGMSGLQEYKEGDDILFGITNNNPTDNKLDFRDLAMVDYAAEGEDAHDLSRNETAFIQATRNYLDDPANDEINVIMWSWCNIAGHDVAGNYIPGMQTLIDEYGKGGSKVGSGDGQRENAVTFIFMTGHANKNNNTGEGNPKAQAELITNYCKENNYYCLDYYSIDTHDMDGNYWEDAGDDGNSNSYGGHFYADWQDQHQLGEDYFVNKDQPYGEVVFGAHNNQHITANRKAYAMWYILARIAGYNPK